MASDSEAMRRVIIAVVLTVLALAAVTASLVFITALTSVPSGDAINEQSAFYPEEIEKIEVDVSVAFVSVYKTSGSLVEVELVESREGLYSTSLSGGVLTFTESRSSWTDKLFRSDINRYGISIGIPEGMSVGLGIDAETSAVTLSGVTLTGSTEISVRTGSITINDVKTDGYISADITTGNVSYDGVTCNEISADVTTGDVFIRNVNAGKAISLTTVTGRVYGFISGSRDDYRITAVTDNGTSSLKSGGDGDVELIVKVATGNINIK